MPWHEESPMSLRQQFIQDAQRKTLSITELCVAYGISRKTGYKWLARYEAGGFSALADQSRRPQTSPTPDVADGGSVGLGPAPPGRSTAPSELGPAQTPPPRPPAAP